MKEIDSFGKEIDELTKIKQSINEIKRNYQTINNNLEIKKDVRKMIDILDNIYIEIFNNTHNLKLFRMYGEIYLPTITKIINRYNNLADKNIKSTNAKELLNNIEISIKKLNVHLQNKYNSFFEDEIIDLDADIKVLIQELNKKLESLSDRDYDFVNRIVSKLN